MPLIKTLRNAVEWAGLDLGRSDRAVVQAVVLVDPTSGAAYAASAGSTASISGGSGSGLTPDVASSRAWASNGLSYVEQRTLGDGSVETRTITVRTAYQVADWTAVGAWTSTDGGIPANALTLNGEPLTLNGEYIVIQ